MPKYDFFTPAATNIKLVSRGREIPVNKDTVCFNRVGEDGSLIITPIFGGDEYVGLVLEGMWVKGWDSGMDADQTFTAILNQAGALEFEGEGDIAGTWGKGWLNSKHGVPLFHDTEITVSLELPVDNTGVVADRDIGFDFFLLGDKVATVPDGEDNYFAIRNYVEEYVNPDGGMYIVVEESVANVVTELHNSPTYVDGLDPAVGALEGQIWRMVFHDGDPAATGVQASRHMHVYLKQSDSIVAAETAVENELDTSPYAINDYLFDIAYPAYELRSQNTSYFDSGGEAKSYYVRVKPPPFRLIYDPPTAADRMKNEVELWDGDPGNGGKRVYDIDHQYSSDPYIKNGLIQTHIDIGVQYGVKLYYYNSGYIQITDRLIFHGDVDVIARTYPQLVEVKKNTPEEVIVRLRLTNSSSWEDDTYAEADFTVKRGQIGYLISNIEMHPQQLINFYTSIPTAIERFGATISGVSDKDISTEYSDTTLLDNIIVAFDDANEEMIQFVSSNRKPISQYTWRGTTQGFLDIDPNKVAGFVLQVGYTPFSLIANLFEQAEDGSYGAAGTVTDAAADPLIGSDNAVQLNAIGNFQTPAGEYSAYTFTAGTHLPAGRYRAVVRARFVDTETMQMYVWNDTDDEYRNEENAKVTKTLTVSYAYYSLVFDITATDVAGTDSFAVVAEKTTDDADEIRTDYVLIIPIGDGESFPQDLAHDVLRGKQQEKRLYLR